MTVVAEVVRNGFVESVHHGRVVALDSSGQVVLTVGDVTAPFFPRSAMKPLQTLGMLRAGWTPADDEQVAIACASHSGERAHVDVVRRVLSDAGLDDAALDNTPSFPLSEDAKRDMIRTGSGPDRLHQNCSGKHAAMLATCVANEWPIDSYLNPAHPLQVAIRKAIEELTGEQIAATAVDGCGAPLYALSLVAVAGAFRQLVSNQPGSAERRVADAMRSNPFLVGGSDRDVTTLMRDVDGLLVKDGAEGVCAAATGDGAGLALKIDDGAARARTPVLIAALARLGITVEGTSLTAPEVLGHGRPVGGIRATL